MSIADQMKSLTHEVLSSYEDRLDNIEAIFSDTHQLLDDFQKALFETRQERESLGDQLRERLAKTDSLRRKDFDQMMQGVWQKQNEREKEVRKLLGDYLTEQKGVTGVLKKDLADFNKKLVGGERIRLEEFKQKFAEIKREQLVRQDQVMKMLKDFQAEVAQYRRENEELAKNIKSLLSQGEAIRLRDFKTMFGGFQKDRQAAAEAWSALSSVMARKRAEAKEVMAAGK